MRVIIKGKFYFYNSHMKISLEKWKILNNFDINFFMVWLKKNIVSIYNWDWTQIQKLRPTSALFLHCTPLYGVILILVNLWLKYIHIYWLNFYFKIINPTFLKKKPLQKTTNRNQIINKGTLKIKCYHFSVYVEHVDCFICTWTLNFILNEIKMFRSCITS